MSYASHRLAPGPFTADQVREGDPYELSNGHAIQCLSAGPSHAGPNLSGGEVVDSDPDVEWTGVDVGYSPEPGTLRAADVGVGKPATSDHGWDPGTPRLALEYAGKGQDEDRLQEKIHEFFAAGTEVIWVIRLLGPRRVEVYRPEKAVEIRNVGDQLTAPGILRNPVPVEALYDRQAAHRVVLRNLLQRQGYEDLEQVRREGVKEGVKKGKAVGLAESILELLDDRGLEVDEATRERLLACRDLDALRRWLRRSIRVPTVAALFTEDE